ncbi:hypothetical protein [Listeria fleischmannii]|uniref:hypothetical protein n=1 Tax=Listeria fleischmannii TaxID=1069827 RepID=UPI0011E9F5D1
MKAFVYKQVGKYGSGWFLLRMSLHEPVMPLNIESDTKGGIDLILTDLRPFFEGYKALKF